MKQSLTLLLLSTALAAVSGKSTQDGHSNSCDSPCFAGFTDIPGISSFCNNAVGPKTTITNLITGTVVETVVV